MKRVLKIVAICFLLSLLTSTIIGFVVQDNVNNKLELVTKTYTCKVTKSYHLDGKLSSESIGECYEK